jgi:hypothetical protein
MGPDGASYSAEAFVDDDLEGEKQYGAAVLFIRWSADGSKPAGHLETGYLAHGETAKIARSAVDRLTLFAVKEHLDRLVEESKGRSCW